MKPIKIIRLLPALALAAAMVSCTGKKAQTVVGHEEEIPKVKLQPVSTRSVDQTYEFTGTVEAFVKNNIAPMMGLRISKILVEVGDVVAKGQQLAEMDPTNLLQARAQLENYKVEFARVDELYKIGGSSKSQWDALKLQVDVAQSTCDNLAENTTLTSPIAGVVTARNYDNGDMYGGMQPIVVVEQIVPVKLMINVSESFFRYVSKGQSVSVKFDVYGEEEFIGKVSLVYPTIDPQTRTFPVEITIPNSALKVRPGMFARVTISFGALDHVVIPDRAVIKQPGSGDRYVYIYRDGKVHYTKIEVGRRMGEEYEVLSGVADGDRVVMTGHNRLNDGVEVQIDNAAN